MPKSKVCKKCNKKLNSDRFPNMGRGLLCIKCTSIRNKNRRKDKKNKAVEYKGGKCIDCNKKYCNEVYDFHHLIPDEKDVPPTRLMMQSWNKIVKEIDKCVLLCANCHRIRHANNK